MNRRAAKTVIVTGGAVSIDLACVIRMAEEGGKIAFFEQNEAEGRALPDELTANGKDAAFLAAEATDEAALKSAIDAAATRFESLHVPSTTPAFRAAPSRPGEPDDVA